MPIIGLTGGIGTGKSTVASIIKEHGYKVLDADEMSRGLTEKGSPVLMEIGHALGNEWILPDGSLDRKGLAALVFANPEKKRTLESLVTHRVIEMMDKEAEDFRRLHPQETMFMDVPLLFECGWEEACDRVWLVTCSKEKRIARVMERDGSSAEDVERRMAGQLPDKYKIARAHVVIDNSGDMNLLIKQIERLLKEYA